MLVLVLIPILLILILFLLFKWSNSSSIAKVSVSEKLIALTFDDGPNSGETESLLDTLDRKKVRATFFLLGKHVAAYPEIAAEIKDRGHEIGNHSYNHRFMIGIRKRPNLTELLKTNQTIEAATGVKPTLFRPPYLVQGPGLKRAVGQLGIQSISAISNRKTLRFQDWAIQDQPEKIAQIIIEAAQPGFIFVLHDGHAGAKSPASQRYRGGTVKAVGLIIDKLHGEGYQFVTVSELLMRTHNSKV
jgi:peptidoglycan/xylan/chitin deacetylase (PgdA/CDA1 family)